MKRTKLLYFCAVSRLLTRLRKPGQADGVRDSSGTLNSRVLTSGCDSTARHAFTVCTGLDMLPVPSRFFDRPRTGLKAPYRTEKINRSTCVGFSSCQSTLNDRTLLTVSYVQGLTQPQRRRTKTTQHGQWFHKKTRISRSARMIDFRASDIEEDNTQKLRHSHVLYFHSTDAILWLPSTTHWGPSTKTSVGGRVDISSTPRKPKTFLQRTGTRLTMDFA